jgi:hypothetical protein
MAQRLADRPSKACQGTNLISAVFEDLLLGPGDLAAAEVLAVGESWMSAGLHVLPRGGFQGRKSRNGVASVETAGDIRRGDERHQVVIVGAALAKVAVQIDFHKADESESMTRRQWPRSQTSPGLNRRLVGQMI